LLVALTAVLVLALVHQSASATTAAGRADALVLIGFSDTQVATPAANPLSSPTAIVPLLAAGRALVLEKGGAVRVLDADGTMAVADAIDLNVCTDSEEGLLGAAADPDFATNGFVYLYYTHDEGNCASSTGRFNRVSRFTMTGDTINPASEVLLLDNMNIPAGNHNGGALHVGNDGDLYVTVGDGGTNPRGAGGSAAQDLSLLNGKILRITRTGGVPADNPFVGTPNAMSCAMAGIGAPTTARCTEIYDDGLRNPYRFAFDPNTSATRFYIDDVGENTWEEVDAGGSGLNYGWDTREGFCENGVSTNCTATPAGLTDPLTSYNHSSGCTFITAGAFIPNGIWDASFDGGYLFADGGCGKVWLLTRAGLVDYSSPFAMTTGTISDMTFLTQGGQTALYYVTNGSSELRRITLPTPPPVLPPTPLQPPVTPPIAPPVAPPLTTAPFHCTVADVRGLLAARATTRIAAAHCKVRRIVVAMRHGAPLVRHHRLVRASSASRPGSRAGAHRVWTLRVERVLQAPGATHTAGFRETIYVGWEATPTAIARKRGARFV
jgi:glucose/arabinose dehydrogenase